MTEPMRRASPSGELWELLRSFRGSRGHTVAVIRNTENHIRNCTLEVYESWPEVQM